MWRSRVVLAGGVGLCFLVPQGVRAQSPGFETDVTSHIFWGVPDGPSCMSDGFYMAEATCGDGSASGTISTLLGSGSNNGLVTIQTEFSGTPSATSGSGFADGVGMFRNSSFTVTGPVSPTQIVFYLFLDQTVTGPAGGTQSLELQVGCDNGGGEVVYVPTSTNRVQVTCDYTGANEPYTFLGYGMASYVSGQTIIQRAGIAGVDVLDAHGNSLATTDQIVFSDGGQYFLGNPFASTVPEPTSLALLVSGLLGFAPLLRRRRRELLAAVTLPLVGLAGIHTTANAQELSPFYSDVDGYIHWAGDAVTPGVCPGTGFMAAFAICPNAQTNSRSGWEGVRVSPGRIQHGGKRNPVPLKFWVSNWVSK